MTIREVELQTGLTRSSIRFYEKEKLIVPSRNEKNGYRDYSEKDVEDIKKTAYLRTLGISIEDIRNLQSGTAALREVIQKQNDALKEQIADLNQAKFMCEKMLASQNIHYENLQVEQYVTELQNYWNDNRPVFKLDSVRFLYLWGSFLIWAVITGLCLLTGVLSYAKLPTEIPVQWSGGMAASLVSKKWIFSYPIACAAFRMFLRPFLYGRLWMYRRFCEITAEYLTNYLCFLALSVEIFSILFVYGVVQNVVMVLAVDTVVLIGLLLVGISKVNQQ